MKRLVLSLGIIAALAALTGCLPNDDATAVLETCPADSLLGLVGEPETAVAGIGYDGPVRVIHPGDMVTKDFRPERLNVHIDAGGRIEMVICG